MTDTAPAATDLEWPYEFEGTPVDKATLAIQMGNIIEQTMEVDPARWPKDDQVTFVVRCTIKDVDHRSKPKREQGEEGGKNFVRHHVATALVITPVDDDLVRSALDAQKERIDANKGVRRLFGADGQPTEPQDGDEPDEPGD